MDNSDLVERLLRSYQVNPRDGQNLPSRHAIARITSNLLRLLFPGFFDDSAIAAKAARQATSELLDETANRLTREIARSLIYAPPPELKGQGVGAAAQHLTTEILGRLVDIRGILATDIEAAFSGDPAALSPDEVVVSYPFVEAIAVQRVAHEMYLREIALIPRMMTEWAHSRSGMDLHPGAQIGSYFFVDHCTGTVVGETSVIGSHVKMYQGVGLVARSLAAGQQLRGKKRHPTIADNVTIYAGATIVGGDTVVGAGSTIGASAFLTHSVPPNSLVLAEDVRVKVINKDRQHVAEPDWEI
jgi:serine O-acetyltransferase